jgi:hypothetical protein
VRKPTDRIVAWAHWRDRIAGIPCAITPDDPKPGFYRAKRRGRHVGVQIDLVAETDPDTGELIAEERIAAFIEDDIFFGEHVFDVWLRCGGQPITEAEFERLQRMPEVSDLTRGVIV